MDREQCAVVWYSDRATDDEHTARFKASSDEWRNTSALSDDAFAEQVRTDQIDVLVDLLGHSGKRLLVFARQPAPLQLSWLGYAGTTGMRAIDYLVADRFHVREGEEPWYSEKIARLPHGYVCYGPPVDAPDIGPLPARECGHMTFGCFNNPGKYSDRLLASWGEILERVPTARLLLKFSGLEDPRIQIDLCHRLKALGTYSNRIVFEGWSSPSELLTTYNRVDLALDTQPYAGGLTTCEALWMGVPVITFPGKTFAGRHATSHLHNAGYPEFVAEDAAGYVRLAVEWAGRLDELARIRSQMRERVRQSPLCDAPRFARDFLAVLREACQQRIRP